MSKNMTTDTYWFKGMKVNNLSYAEVIPRIEAGIDQSGYVCFVEATSAVWSQSDRDFQTALNNSLLSLPDGMPLVWFAKLLGSRKIQRMPGPEVFQDFIENRSEYKHYLLGDTPETINRVIEKAISRNPNLRISGYSPPFRRKFSEEDNADILRRISIVDPDIVWVAFGSAKQAKWMYKIAPRLKRGILMGVGAAFKFYIGVIPTPPRLLQQLGLQWLSRIFDRRMRFFQETLPFRLRFLCYFPLELMRSRARGVSLGQIDSRSLRKRATLPKKAIARE